MRRHTNTPCWKVDRHSAAPQPQPAPQSVGTWDAPRVCRAGQCKGAAEHMVPRCAKPRIHAKPNDGPAAGLAGWTAGCTLPGTRHGGMPGRQQLPARHPVDSWCLCPFRCQGKNTAPNHSPAAPLLAADAAAAPTGRCCCRRACCPCSPAHRLAAPSTPGGIRTAR